jgi:hypothetical protein
MHYLVFLDAERIEHLLFLKNRSMLLLLGRFFLRVRVLLHRDTLYNWVPRICIYVIFFKSRENSEFSDLWKTNYHERPTTMKAQILYLFIYLDLYTDLYQLHRFIDLKNIWSIFLFLFAHLILFPPNSLFQVHFSLWFMWFILLIDMQNCKPNFVLCFIKQS